MAVDWQALDYSDPAALLAQLRPIYYRLIAGDADAEVEGTDRRRVKFHAADAGALRRLINQLEADAARAQGGGRKRYALAGRMHLGRRIFYP